VSQKLAAGGETGQAAREVVGSRPVWGKRNPLLHPGELVRQLMPNILSHNDMRLVSHGHLFRKSNQNWAAIVALRGVR
jgi:hypothetical protein